MKLTATFVLLAVLTVHAKSYSQQAKLSFSFQKTSIADVLSFIEDKTGFYFFYKENELNANKLIDIDIINGDIDLVLERVLAGTNLGYSKMGHYIVISPKDGGNIETVTQQPKTISGKVTDSSGTPLPGVTVVVKGTTTGTITAVDGGYTLSDIPSDAILMFSFVGMRNQEVKVVRKTNINMTMEEETIGIEEVVAIGYGTMKKIDMTGSASSVQAKELIKAPVKSFDEALAGRLAGVQITSNDGQPGSLPNIIIRGANSITQDNSPLYVVDGFPIENNDNNAINTNDIESIDVLKDASATAIYGARGANGVIMITTKRGKEGTPVVNYNGYYGFSQDVNRLNVFEPYDFVKLQLEANSVTATQQYLIWPNRTLDDYKNIQGIDWYEKALQTAPMQSHDISISGGTSRSRFSVSGGYLGQDGIFINTGFSRYQGRVTLDQEITKKLKIGLNANYGYTKSYGVVAASTSGNLSTNLMYSIWAYRPVITSSNMDAAIDYENELTDPAIAIGTDQRTNPFMELENALREVHSHNLLANAYAEYLLTKDLKLRVTGGLNRISSESDEFNNSKTRSGNPLNPQSLGVNGRQTFTNTTNFNNENTLTYTKKIGNGHNLVLLGGFTLQSGKVSRAGTYAIQVPNESLGISGLDEGVPYQIIASQSEWTQESFLFRANYNYKSKYMLTASMRADGSSRFAKENRWGYFPSAAIAYRLSAEEFMKNCKWISETKLRLSYGTTGNNRVSDFASLSPIYKTNASGYSFGNATPTTGVYTGLGNPKLKWETTKQLNAGIDLGFVDSRVSVTADYYYKRTDDLLLNAQLPYMSGYTTAYKNIGSVSNRGFEFALNTVNIATPKFKWNSNFNISFNRNKVLELTEGQEALTSSVSSIYSTNPVYIAKIGRPIAQFYGIVFDGVYQYDDFDKRTNGTYVLKPGILYPAADRNGYVRPGDARYKDLNHDGIINLNDYTIIGDPNPKFIGGFSNNLEYRGFDMSILFQFSYGNDVFNANRVLFEGAGSSADRANINQFITYLDRWTEENPTSTTLPRVNGEKSYYTSRTIEDASFIRLKTVSLGYSLPKEILQRLKVKSIRIYTSGQNLYTWTGYSGVDPEVSTRHSSLTPGFDLYPYPRAKTIIFGVNVTF